MVLGVDWEAIEKRSGTDSGRGLVYIVELGDPVELVSTAEGEL
jgi:hypothetical protein